MGSIITKRFSAAFVDWTKTVLAKLDRRTREEFSITGGLCTRARIARVYLPKHEGGRGLILIEDYVELARIDIDSYVGNSDVYLLNTARITARNRETQNSHELNKQKKRTEVNSLTGKCFAW